MLLYVDLADRRPVYQQLRDQAVEAIADGTLKEGSRLPTTRQLAADLALNFHTVAKAYDLLRQEGFIQMTRRAGTTVRITGEAPAPLWRANLRTVLAEACAKGMPQEEILAACREVLDSFGGSAQTDGS